MPPWDSPENPGADEPVVVVDETPPPAPASSGPSWLCPSCGTQVASPPHVECQVCGTKPDGSH